MQELQSRIGKDTLWELVSLCFLQKEYLLAVPSDFHLAV
jgi:hypothetical protein